MLPVDELVRFAAGLDERHHHPVAASAADAWALERPVFVRSSASHVFVARAAGREQRVVLRLRPDVEPHGMVLERSARAASAWADLGAPVAPPVPSAAGRLVERVDGHVVMALAVVEGDTLEEQGLPDRAGDWGGALARLHLAQPTSVELPHLTDVRPDDDLADSALAARSAALLADLAGLPRTDDVHGALHGDPEADNVVAGPGGLTFVDPDDARRGWFVSDIAFALRDWSPPAGGPDLSTDVPRRFLDGYRAVRPVSAEELAWLPLLAQVSAVESLSTLAPHLRAVPDPAWPSWATDLDARLRARAAVLREALLGSG